MKCHVKSNQHIFFISPLDRSAGDFFKLCYLDTPSFLVDDNFITGGSAGFPFVCFHEYIDFYQFFSTSSVPSAEKMRLRSPDVLFLQFLGRSTMNSTQVIRSLTMHRQA